MSWIIAYAEVLGTISGFICVWLTVRQNPLNWPIGIITNIFFLFVLAQDRLYANVSLQLIFIALGFYGWYMWLYGGENRTELPVGRMRSAQLMISAAAWLAGTVLLATLLKEFARRSGIAPPDYVYWDSSVTAASLVAFWMLSRKKIENWFVWLFLVNLSQVFLFSVKGRYFMVGLQLAYIILAVMGFNAWRKDFARRESEGQAAQLKLAEETIS